LAILFRAQSQSEDQSLATLNFGGIVMLWTIAVILIVLWALGLVSSVTMGGFIHLLLVLAIIAVVFQLIQGRRV
jgi:hypothetical protein